MKAVKFLVKYSLIFIAVSLIASIAAIGGVTYYGLKQLHEERASNENLLEVMRIGEGYVQEIESFENLAQQLQNKKMPPFCKTICNPSTLSEETLISERTPYLTEFYQETGSKALQDPVFRFKLWQMTTVTNAIPSEVRVLLKDILNKEAMDSKNKALLALQLDSAILTNLPSFNHRWERFKLDSDRLGLARNWIKACQKGANSKKLIADCEAEFHISN